MRLSSSQRIPSFTLMSFEFYFEVSSEFPFNTSSEFRFPCTSSNIYYTFLICAILRRHGVEEEWEESHLSVMGVRRRRHRRVSNWVKPNSNMLVLGGPFMQGSQRLSFILLLHPCI